MNIPNMVRRQGSANWWYRESVPRDVQAIRLSTGGPHQKEVWKSLRTPSEREAAKRLVQVRAEQHRAWDLERDVPAAPSERVLPSEAEVQLAIVDVAYNQFGERLAQQRAERAALSQHQWDHYVEEKRAQLARLERRVASRDFAAFDEALDGLIEKRRWLITKHDEDGVLTSTYQHYRLMLADAFLDARRANIQSLAGKLFVEPSSKTVREAVIKRKSGENVLDGLLELFDRYAEVRRRDNSKKEDTLNQDRKVIELLAEYVGPRQSVQSIDKAAIREFRNLLAAVPVKWSSRKDFRGLSLIRAAEKARLEATTPRSLVTVNKELSAVSALFSWMVEEGYVDANPVLGLFNKRAKATAKRRPTFTVDQLNTIFSSPLFTGCSSESGKEHKPGSTIIRDWRFWLPLCAMFTGARLGELAQLHVTDVSMIHECWIFDLVDDPTEDSATVKSLKTPASRRIVPIHRTLIRLGFLSYVESARRAAQTRLFPEIKPNGRGHYGASPSRFWRTYLSRIRLKGRTGTRNGC